MHQRESSYFKRNSDKFFGSDQMEALRRCRNTLQTDNVVLIDIDTCSFNNVIVLDVPESLTKKRIGSADKIRPSRTYIYIDDDESPVNHQTETNINSKRNFDNGASCSRRYGPANTTPVKLSKGKRTYSGRGFSSHSDSDSSDDDSPDCEFMEDSSGKIREKWEKASLEKASLKRKADQNDHGATRDDTSASKSSGDADNGFGLNKNKQKHTQDSNFNETSHETKGESSNCNATVNVDVGRARASVCEDQYTVETDEQVPCSSREEENEKMDVENAPIINDVISEESSIIDQREKLKETDEYKLALEQELLARQLAIKIQAEEAQHQRRMLKRKNAENKRILDMEKRQKERVEEIRETQKKDEETMNLKEQYRMEVISELKKLEITCLDVASLLRGLGCQVGTGPAPSSHEVRVAYKRALFSFHPDRAAVGSDMRKQVEAEEKFKLISRMKEKLPL